MVRFIIGLLLVFALTGCGNTYSDIDSFSYAEELKQYSEQTAGVYREGFNNTSSFEVSNAEDAVKRAENECTIDYNKIDIRYDNTKDMWRITFFTEGTLGGGQSIYLDSNGITHLIVYGE